MDYKIVYPGKAAGVSEINSIAAQTRESMIVFLAEGAVLPSNFAEMLKEKNLSRKLAAGFVLRCLPSQEMFHFHPVSLEANFVWGSAFVLGSSALAELGFFDTRLPFSYTVVDYCWRARAAGKKFYYCPDIFVRNCPENENSLMKYKELNISRFLLKCKYASLGEIARGKMEYFRTIKKPVHYPDVRRRLLSAFFANAGKAFSMFFWRFKHRGERKKIPVDFSPDFAPCRGSLVCRDLNYITMGGGAKFSIIIRTRGRKNQLRQALESIAHQSYKRFEVVVIEDGRPECEEMIYNEFSRLPVRYKASGEHIGRSKAGNMGLSMAMGKYNCFLDDDDFLYPEYLEQFALFTRDNPDVDMIICNSMAAKTNIITKEPLNIEYKSIQPAFINRLDVFTMSQECQLNISSVVFKRSLYLKAGGLDEKLDSCEDWSMWLRFLARGKRPNSSGVDICCGLNLFTCPADKDEAKRRYEEYLESRRFLFCDESIRFDVSMMDMRSFYSGVIADIMHVNNLGKLEEYLDAQANRDKDL